MKIDNYGNPVNPPLCGWAWLEEHHRDHTQAEIDSLTIQVSHDGRNFPPVLANQRGTVKTLVKELR